MNTIVKLLDEAVISLQGISETPLLDAEILLASAIEQSRIFLKSKPTFKVTPQQKQQFMQKMTARLQGMPIAYIEGQKEFWSLNLKVTPAVLIPRPETELLVEIILSLGFDEKKSIKVVDLGTGSGAIALALAKERPNWNIYATDFYSKALEIAKENSKNCGLTNITFLKGDWLAALSDKEFDLIVSNPPYIGSQEWSEYGEKLKFEPRQALVSGKDGLDAIITIIQGVKHYLKSQGFLLLEHGFEQADVIHDIFSKEGYINIRHFKDLAGLNRDTIAMKL